MTDRLTAVLCAALACGACQRDVAVRYPTQVAAGRPLTCPDDAVDPFGDGTPGPMDARCSYDDAAGRGLTRLGGSVMAHGEPGSPGIGLSAMRVTVHRVNGAPNPNDPGKRVGHATTDAQGRFHLGASLPAGEYLFIVRASDGGDVLGHRLVELGGNRPRTIDDVVLWVAADPRLSNRP